MTDRTIEAALRGEVLVPAGEAAARRHQAGPARPRRRLGDGPQARPSRPLGRERNLGLGLILPRPVRRARSWRRSAGGTTLGAGVGIEDATTDEAYAAMDWLQGRQELIGKRLARRHLFRAPAIDSHG
jgi:hypothetical protein